MKISNKIPFSWLRESDGMVRDEGREQEEMQENRTRKKKVKVTNQKKND